MTDLTDFEIYQLAAILSAAGRETDADSAVSRMFDCASLIRQRLDFTLRAERSPLPGQKPDEA